MSKIAFSVATREELEAVGKGRTIIARPSILSPLVEAYLGLKELFGEPKPEYMDEPKIQWIFLIKTDGAGIEVNDYKLESWSIHVYEQNNDEGRAERVIKELEKQIAHAAMKHRALISNLLKRPAGHVIENPFALYYQTAREVLELAEKFQSTRSDLSGSEPKLSDWSTQNTLCQAAFFQFIAAIEGFLNLVYEVYLKVELRDDRIVERLLREQIDVKLRLAPIYCECFAGKPIDHTTEAFRNFHRLINSRNDFIHANVTKSMKTPVLSHDDMIFTMTSRTCENGLGLSSIRDLGIEEVKEIKATIDGIVAQVLANMNPRYRRDFGSVMYQDFINVDYEDGVPVIVG